MRGKFIFNLKLIACVFNNNVLKTERDTDSTLHLGQWLDRFNRFNRLILI